MNENDIRNFINSSSLGVYTKYIKVVDGYKYLVKSGRGDGKSKSSILEPVTECICYEFAKEMGIECAEYTLEEHDGELISISKWFYDESIEKFYSANRLMRILNLTRDDLYNKFIDNIEDIQIHVDNMIIFDYIVNNTDRHLKNFGFLINEDKIRFAPIYDNGLALGSHLDDEEIEFEEISDLLLDADYAKCFDTSNKKQLELVKKCTLNIDFDYEYIVKKYSKYLSEKRMEFIMELLKDRILEVKKCLFQNQK
ncbi:HipA family kinase [Clostridium gasigenes]|uniref:HipA family kinase n=1 Tax=Clostridium gasigenes TaxID=94869 RepID=UPI0014385067|nr:HipA family kinase [Clostridium gasigenes]MBU3105117.1 HipA domain-containing protein [Clostridium gasigenes]NKF08774.1 HipA domain-containing protein [Clostridium gasigenes]QSW19611.1 HipA domain-containing protein [Clostridium gasigenes]